MSPAERAEAKPRLQALKQWRSGLGARLKLDPALLWPAASLERLSRKPRTIDQEMGAREVRRWQREEFGEELRAALTTET